MLNIEFIKSLKKTFLFFIVYTCIFALIYLTSLYTFPFMVAFAIALIIQPISRFFGEKLKFRQNAPALLASTIVYILIFTLMAFIFYSTITEVRLLLKNISSADLDQIVEPVQSITSEISQYFQNAGPFFIEENSGQLARTLRNILNIIGKSLNAFLSIALSIPMWISIVFVVIFSTYFFTRDMSNIKKSLITILSERGKEKIEVIWNQGLKMLIKYIKAYFLICLLTFIQTLIGFTILGVKYSVLLSFICAFADILPVFGIGLVYLPLAAIYIISGNYFTGFGILILLALIGIIRQIIEPKILSASLGIHPVTTLITIFIGLKAFGFLGMIYLTFLVVFYKVLKNTKII